MKKCCGKLSGNVFVEFYVEILYKCLTKKYTGAQFEKYQLTLLEAIGGMQPHDGARYAKWAASMNKMNAQAIEAKKAEPILTLAIPPLKNLLLAVIVLSRFPVH